MFLKTYVYLFSNFGGKINVQVTLLNSEETGNETIQKAFFNVNSKT